MMLRATKSTYLSGDVVIGTTTVMNLVANIQRENIDYTTINQTILNQELYNAHKVECRKDVAEFQQMVYEIEDSFAEELTKEDTKVK